MHFQVSLIIGISMFMRCHRYAYLLTKNPAVHMNYIFTKINICDPLPKCPMYIYVYIHVHVYSTHEREGGNFGSLTSTLILCSLLHWKPTKTNEVSAILVAVFNIKIYSTALLVSGSLLVLSHARVHACI